MLPSKLTAGQNFKQSVVRAINEIIDCLRKQRVVGDNNTIQVSEGTNGVLIRAIPQGSSPKGGSKYVEKHPFKLSIATDELDVQVLTIQRGLVKIQGSNNDRCIFVYEENESSLPVNLPLPTEEGTYNVIGYVAKYLPTDTPANDDGAFRHGVVYSTSNVNGDITSSYGFWTFVIGRIIVAVDENENISYSIDEQYLKSDFVIDDSAKSDLYSPLLYKSAYPTDGDVVADFIADKIRITSGYFGTPEGKVVVPENTFDLADGKTIVITYNTADNTADNTAVYEQKNTSEITYQDETKTIYYYPVIGIEDDDYTSWIIKRYIKDSFYGFDTYKIKVDDEDTKPDYIKNKIENEELESSEEADEDYIDVFYKEKTVNEVIEKSMKWYWKYKDISGYDATKLQYILNNKDSLCFDDAGKVRVNSADTTLGFLASKIHDGKYTIARTKSDSYIQIDARALEAGKHINITAGTDGDGDSTWKIKAIAPEVNGDSNISVTTTDDGWIINLKGKKYNVLANSPILCNTSSDTLTLTDTFTLDFDFSKIKIDENLASLIEIDYSTPGEITLKSVLTGSGIIICNNGTFSVLEAPTSDSLLKGSSSGFSWVPYSTCENSCS